jgi:hypothetical protein
MNNSKLQYKKVMQNGCITDPATLESMACREALTLAEDLNLHRIVVALDCKEVVTAIAEGTKGR